MLGHPSVRVFSVQGLAGDGGIDAFEGGRWGYRPIGTEGEVGPGIEQVAEGVRRFDALRADAFFCPAAVVNRVVGLHGGDDAEFCEALDGTAGQVLGMFDAETAVAGPVEGFGLGIHVEQPVVGAVADGVYCHV